MKSDNKESQPITKAVYLPISTVLSMRSRKCAYLIEIGLKIEKKFSHDFMGLFHSMWEKTPLKSGLLRCARMLLSDSCPGIDENVEMGLREKKERFRSLKRFTQEKESIFPHCKKKFAF